MRFTSLDTLRGLAALCVVLFHLAPGFPGYLMVDLFFILSGFVLAYRYFDNPDCKDMTGISFAVARFSRMYPLHLFTLLLVVAIFHFTDTTPTYGDGQLFSFVQHLFLLHNVGLNTHWLSWNEPSWSISVEFWANVIVFIWLIKRCNNLGYFCIAMFGYILILQTVGNLDVHVHKVAWVFNAGLIKCLAGICFGILVYRAYNFFNARIELSKPLFVAGFTVLEISFLLACYFQIFGSEIRAKTDFVVPFLFSATVFIFAFQAGLISKLFALTKSDFLGTISYSVYLNHYWILHLLKTTWFDPYGWAPTNLLIVLSIIIGVSIVTYYAIERPGQKYMRQLYHYLHNKKLANEPGTVPPA